MTLPLLGTGGSMVLLGDDVPRRLQGSRELLARNTQNPLDSLVSSWRTPGEIDAIVGSDFAMRVLRVGIRADVHRHPAGASGLLMTG
jgi:hypothetical protein